MREKEEMSTPMIYLYCDIESLILQVNAKAIQTFCVMGEPLIAKEDTIHVTKLKDDEFLPC